MEYTKEMIEKAKTAESAEELLELAKENDIEMSAEEAEVCFTELHPESGELSDEELENVSGGGCYENRYKKVDSHQCCEHWLCKVHKTPAVVRPDGSQYCKECFSYYTICDNCYYCLKQWKKNEENVYRCRYK